MSALLHGWGSSQHSRLAPALDARAVGLDERSPAQLMAFAPGFAKLLNYFDEHGEASADWSAFWRSDITFLLAEVACAATAAHDLPQAEAERAYAQAARINEWYLAAHNYDAQHLQLPANPLYLTLGALIEQDLAPALATLRSVHLPAGHGSVAWAPAWSAAPATSTKTRAQAAQTLAAIGETFRRAIVKLSALAHDYLAQALQQPDHPPHTTLYLAFLRLLKVLQGDMNGFVERHLDFYIRSVLRLQPHAAEPDSCTLVFGLAPTRPSFLLPAGSTASAGQDADGNPILYAVGVATQLNQASIAALCTVLCARAGTAAAPVTGIYAAPVADSQDGLGTPLTDPALGWPTFGQAPAPDASERARLDATLGFMLASPALLLSEGRRVVRLLISLDAGAGSVLDTYQSAAGCMPAGAPRRMQALPADAFLLYVSGSKDWNQVSGVSLWRLRGSNALVLKFTLPEGAPGVLANAALAPAAGSTVPLLKAQLNPGAALYAYSYLQALQITAVSLNVKVQGLRTLQLDNGSGPIAAGKPFSPFGSAPLPGMSWQIAHAEFGAKALTWAAISLDWLNLPFAQPPQGPGMPVIPNGFAQYYAGYQPYVFSNDIFTVNLAVYNNGAWVALPPAGGTDAPSAYPLFASFNGSALGHMAWLLKLAGTLPGAAASATAPAPGTLSMTLAAPSYGFGQAQYPQLFAAQAIKNIVAIDASMKQPSTGAWLAGLAGKLASAVKSGLKKIGAVPGKIIDWIKSLFGKAAPSGASAAGTGSGASTGSSGTSASAASSTASAGTTTPAVVMLNPPITPTVSTVSVAYHAQDTAPGFYHIYPFGLALPQQEQPGLFPLTSGDGALYIGLANATAGQALSMHIELRAAPASFVVLESGAAGVARAPIAWSYLADDVWQPFPAASVSSHTEELGCSGIVALQLPSQASAGNGVMQAVAPAGTFWICASAAHQPAAYSKTVALLPQAASASRVLGNGVDGTTTLAAGSISLMSPAIAAIKTVSQPYASAGGRARESTPAFHARVSERLKHKQRASQPRDYEQLVLDAFPGLWQVKCIGPNNSRQFAAAMQCPPGEIMLAVLPPIQPQPQLTAPLFEPALAAIAACIQPLCSPFVRALCVRNAAFELLLVSVTVQYQAGSDASECTNQLNDAINAFLSPWQRQPAPQLDLGCGMVPMAGILALIRGQSYVASASAFQVSQQFQDQPDSAQTLGEDDVAVPRAPWSALVPAVRHAITLGSGAAPAAAPANTAPSGPETVPLAASPAVPASSATSAADTAAAASSAAPSSIVSSSVPAGPAAGAAADSVTSASDTAALAPSPSLSVGGAAPACASAALAPGAPDTLPAAPPDAAPPSLTGSDAQAGAPITPEPGTPDAPETAPSPPAGPAVAVAADGASDTAAHGRLASWRSAFRARWAAWRASFASWRAAHGRRPAPVEPSLDAAPVAEPAPTPAVEIPAAAVPDEEATRAPVQELAAVSVPAATPEPAPAAPAAPPESSYWIALPVPPRKAP